MAHGRKPLYDCPNCGPVWRVEATGNTPVCCTSCGSHRLEAVLKKRQPVYHYLTRDEKLNLPDGLPDTLKDDAE